MPGTSQTLGYLDHATECVVWCGITNYTINNKDKHILTDHEGTVKAWYPCCLVLVGMEYILPFSLCPVPGTSGP